LPFLVPVSLSKIPLAFFHQMSISPTFYEQLNCSRVIFASFWRLNFRFILFWRKKSGAKGTLKMLVKLTPARKTVNGNPAHKAKNANYLFLVILSFLFSLYFYIFFFNGDAYLSCSIVFQFLSLFLTLPFHTGEHLCPSLLLCNDVSISLYLSRFLIYLYLFLNHFLVHSSCHFFLSFYLLTWLSVYFFSLSI
jgi:hypothetical protein